MRLVAATSSYSYEKASRRLKIVGVACVTIITLVYLYT